MGQIQTYTANKAVFHEGQANTVLSVTELRQFAVRYTNGEGRETMALVAQFGTMDDGGAGVFLLATETQMAEQLRRLPAGMLEQIRGAIASVAATQPGKISLNEDAASNLDDLDISE